MRKTCNVTESAYDWRDNFGKSWSMWLDYMRAKHEGRIYGPFQKEMLNAS